MFDINGGEFIGLAIIALLVFGPDRLPRVAADAGKWVRQIRTLIAQVREQVGEELGPEFKNISLADLNARSLVTKHLLDGDTDPLGLADASPATDHSPAPPAPTKTEPRYDEDVT